MSLKKNFILILLLCHISSELTAATIERPIVNQTLLSRVQRWLQSFFSTQKDWRAQYKKKEDFNAKRSITDPINAAQAFKESVITAIQKSPLMEIFLEGLPQNFFFGGSSSHYQIEGGLDDKNASANFYKKQEYGTAGNAIDFWNKYEQDIKEMKEELGLNSFRLSIAWERVETSPGVYDEEAIQHYLKIIQACKNHGIEPIVVLHHYTIPIWFANMDGFEKQENLMYFVNFAKKMYEALHNDVTFWSTFNAIEGYAFKGYFTGDGPPQKKDLPLTQQVMANMLEAHVQIYGELKKLYREYTQTKKIPKPQIGIQKNIVLLRPDEKDFFPKRIGSKITSSIGMAAQNDGFFSFFTTGTFNVWIPTKASLSYTNKNAPGSIDWIGINIYSDQKMSLLKQIPETDPEFMTENPNYRDYPEGIYHATQIISDNIAKPLNIPIIITENGIAKKSILDHDNEEGKAGDEKRTRFFRRALYTIRKLLDEGHNIIGYTPWSTHDNYEWPTPTQKTGFGGRRYGQFFVNFDATSSDYLKHTLKPGAYYYRDFLKQYFNPQKLPVKNIHFDPQHLPILDISKE